MRHPNSLRCLSITITILLIQTTLSCWKMFLSFQYVTFIPSSSFSFTKQTIFTHYLLLTIIASTTALVYVPKLPIATLFNAVFQRIKNTLHSLAISVIFKLCITYYTNQFLYEIFQRLINHIDVCKYKKLKRK